MKNMSSSDRWVRAIVGIVLVVVGYVWLMTAWQVVFYVVGIILLLTALFGMCPIYSLFGINTNKEGAVSSAPKPMEQGTPLNEMPEQDEHIHKEGMDDHSHDHEDHPMGQ